MTDLELNILNCKVMKTVLCTCSRIDLLFKL